MTHYHSFTDRRLLLLLLVSLLLHSAGLLLLNRWSNRTAASLSKAQPLYVEMRDPQRPAIFDTPPPAAVQPPRTTPARRLGAHEQVAPKETAPQGTAPFDRVPALAPQRPVPATPPQPPVERTPPVTAPPGGSLGSPTASTPPALPNRPQLLASANQAAERVAADWAQKIRDEVQRGDAIWYDTEQDLLISFFQRFRTGIYNVWVYPAAAAAQNAHGTCLLRITINRAGLAEDVTVVASSGHRLLDEEAVNAVQKASTAFGYLPSSYPKDRLIFYAYFHYLIGNKTNITGN